MSVKFNDYSVQVKRAVGESAIAALYAAAGEIQSAAIRNSPVKTGQLKNSWAYVVDEEKMVATIGSPLENAIWNEFGTGEYALHGDGRRGGWHYQDEEGNWHHTYGKAPQRTLFRAFNATRNTVQKLFEQEMRTLSKRTKSSGVNTNNKTSGKKSQKSLKETVKNTYKATYKTVQNPSLTLPKPSLPKMPKSSLPKRFKNSAVSKGIKKGNAIAKKISGK